MDPGGKRSVAGPAHEWPRSPHTRPLAPGRFDQEHRVGGVILLASEARNGRPSRRRTPETYPAGPRGDFPPAREPTRDSPAGWGRSARAGRRGPFRTECRAPLASALGIGPLSVPWQGLQPRALVTKKMAQSLPLPRCGPNSRIGQSCTTGSHTAPWHRALPLGAS